MKRSRRNRIRRYNKAIACAILLASSACAQNPLADWALKDMQWRIDAWTKIFLCTAWGITAGLLSLIVILAGIKYLTGKDAEDRAKTRKTLIGGAIGLFIIIAACPVVNYIVHGSNVAEFKCDCIILPPATTTTTTTTTVPTGQPGTRPTTTTTTTTIMSVTTMYPKSGGGRFLLVGNHKFMAYDKYKPEDVYGVIFNMDGSIYKNPFYIDNDPGPVALAVGANRFFIAYGSNILILDWEAKTIKPKFTMGGGYIPVKAVQTQSQFYLLISPEGGGNCVIQVYGLDGNLIDAYTTEIPSIPSALINLLGGFGGMGGGNPTTKMPEADMALANDRLFITWYEKGSDTVYGIIYNLKGTKVNEKFTIKSGIGEKCKFGAMGLFGERSGDDNTYVNPEVEAGGRYYLVAVKDKLYLYDVETGQYKGEKPLTTSCIHDFVYGGGKFLSAQDNQGKFYDEDGNEAGQGTFGGHGDQPTSLSYGNKMFVGIVAIHLNEGDGIGASFMDPSGKHLIDTLPMLMAESPGYAAYDW